MKISMGADHGGFALKEHIKNYLTQKGHEVVDMGTYSTDSCDYPDFGYAAAKKLADGEVDRAIVICSTGIGISITANKVKASEFPLRRTRSRVSAAPCAASRILLR